MAGIAIMNTLRANVTDYLATRRAMGFKVEGLSELLWSFVAFCEAKKIPRGSKERTEYVVSKDAGLI